MTRFVMTNKRLRSKTRGEGVLSKELRSGQKRDRHNQRIGAWSIVVCVAGEVRGNGNGSCVDAEDAKERADKVEAT